MPRGAIRIMGWSLRRLARRFPAKPPAEVYQVFRETLRAMRIGAGNYHLVYIPLDAVQFARRNPNGGSIDNLRSVTDGEYGCVGSIGLLGECVDRVAYVVHSDAGAADERATTIHEALHFAFGSHPWPHERGRTDE